MLTPGGWKLPIWILERLIGLVTKAMSSQRAPEDIVLGLLSLVEHPDGRDEDDEIKRQRHKAAFWRMATYSTPARTRRSLGSLRATSSGKLFSARFKRDITTPSSTSTATRSF